MVINMKTEDLILGRVSLNAYTIKNRQTPSPVIEILDGVGSADGEIVVLKVLKSGIFKC